MSADAIQLTAKKLAGSRKAYIDDWLVPMWPGLGWSSVAEFIFWHAVAGWARGSDKAADNALGTARKGKATTLRTRSRELWEFIPPAIPPLARRHADPLMMLSTKDVPTAFHGLDAIKHIGPKIAAFTLRDLSFLRDVRQRSVRWFAGLPEDWQAAFMPIDRHVYDALRGAKASPTVRKRTVYEIQADVDMHLRVGLDLVRWARKRSFDPRDVNVFWFSYARGDVDQEGNPMPDE